MQISNIFIRRDLLTLTSALQTCSFTTLDELDSFVYCDLVIFTLFSCSAEAKVTPEGERKATASAASMKEDRFLVVHLGC